MSIGAATLAAVRQALGGLLASGTTCVVVHTTAHVSDGAGGYTDQTSSAPPVACLVESVGDTIGRAGAADAGRLMSGQLWRIHLPATTRVQARDRIVANGVTYYVLGLAGIGAPAGVLSLTVSTVSH